MPKARVYLSNQVLLSLFSVDIIIFFLLRSAPENFSIKKFWVLFSSDFRAVKRAVAFTELYVSGIFESSH